MSPAVSVVIPTWNGLDLLRDNLPSVLAAVRFYSQKEGVPVEVIVVDDGSRDGTAEAAAREFPQVRLVGKSRNEGFAAACNAGFQHCRFPLIALLNNDVRVEKEYLVHQVEHFQDARVFAVTSKVFEWEPPIFATGGRFGRFRRGFWSVYLNYDTLGPDQDEWIRGHKLLSAYAIGGFATYDRAKLEELGGFSELLSPFHWEDVDLSYRGWKAGWEIHYEPRSRAHHRISATIEAHYDKRMVETVSWRNRLLFHWVNLHSPGFLVRHLAMVGVFLLTRFLALDFGFYVAFAQALTRLPQVYRLRIRERRRAQRSDVEVARRLSRFYQSAPIKIYSDRRQVQKEHPESQALDCPARISHEGL